VAELLLPPDEEARLKALHDLGILDTPDEERFDRITRLAARLFDVPIALVSLIDADRQWAKSCVGLDAREAPRSASFCARAILGDEQLVVEDAATDPAFAGNPQVTGPPHLRFYAGHVLRTPSGHRLGTLCVSGTEPRPFGDGDRAALAELAALAEQELASTELGEALRSRAETEMRLRALMDTVADAIVSFGDDGVIESVNAAAEMLFGLPRTFVLGERVDKLLDRLNWARLRPLLSDGPESVVGMTVEVVGRRADYSTFPLELTVGRTRVGRRTLYVAVGRDITARKAAERDLERARRRTEHVLEAAGEGILGIDGDGCVMFVNRAGAATLGREPGAMAGRPLDEVVPREAPEGGLVPFARSPIAATLQDGVQRRFERRIHRADGTWFPAELVVSAAASDDSDVRAVLVFRDVSQRYEIDRMKDEFVSVVGHELRTPLTSIRGSLGLLAGGVLGDLSPEAGRMVDIAVSNADRLVRLINDILDLERIESGRLDFEREPQHARELFEQTLQVVGAVAAERGIAVRVEAGDEAVLGDHDRLVQALTNLAGNAVKFSPEGSEVVLRACARGDEVRLEVCDRGRGIPAEHLGRIFERFEQVDASDAREKGGTGLGLAIARSIAEQHGGRIWAESEPGSTFAIALPRLPSAAEHRTPVGADE
jgi:PAS domain S-box-containing protein